MIGYTHNLYIVCNIPWNWINGNKTPAHISHRPVLSDSEDDSFIEDIDTDRTLNHDESIEKKSIFQMIGYASLGKCGEYYVLSGILLILILVCINLLIIEFELLSKVVDDEKYTFLYIVLYTLPMVFILNWEQVTIVSYISVTSIVTIVITIVVVFILCMNKFDGKKVSDEYYDNNLDVNSAEYIINSSSIMQRIFFSFVTFKSGICATSFIPPLIMSLKDKSWKNIK